MQLGCIAQGLLQHLAFNFRKAVWGQFRSWLRTMKTDRVPSEFVVAHALRGTLFEFLASEPAENELREILTQNIDPTQVPDSRMIA